eukprot:474845-Pleurochrysis_carterae.AAC.3
MGSPTRSTRGKEGERDREYGRAGGGGRGARKHKGAGTKTQRNVVEGAASGERVGTRGSKAPGVNEGQQGAG